MEMKLTEGGVNLLSCDAQL